MKRAKARAALPVRRSCAARLPVPARLGSHAPRLSRKPRTCVLSITKAPADSISLSSTLNSSPRLFFQWYQALSKQTSFKESSKLQKDDFFKTEERERLAQI